MLYAIFYEPVTNNSKKYAAKYRCLPTQVLNGEIKIVGVFGLGIEAMTFKFCDGHYNYGEFLGYVSEAQLPAVYQLIIKQFGWGDGEEFILLEGFPQSEMYYELVEPHGIDE